LFQKLERAHCPDSVGFVPEYEADDGAEADYEEVFAAETRQEKREVCHVEDGAESGIKEESWEQEPAQLHIMPDDSNLDLTDEKIMSADLLLIHQT